MTGLCLASSLSQSFILVYLHLAFYPHHSPQNFSVPCLYFSMENTFSWGKKWFLLWVLLTSCEEAWRGFNTNDTNNRLSETKLVSANQCTFTFVGWWLGWSLSLSFHGYFSSCRVICRMWKNPGGLLFYTMNMLYYFYHFINYIEPVILHFSLRSAWF